MEKRQQYVVPGIQNLGNTCFFNAILQALASLRSYNEYLSQIVGIAQNKLPFTEALKDCLDELTPVEKGKDCSAIAPIRLEAELCKKIVNFRGSKQQDSQELLQFLINLVDEEQQVCRKRDIGLKNFLMEYPNPSSLPLGSIAPSISASQFIELNDDRKRNPLYGLQGSLLKCARCNQSQPVNTHRFLDISLFFEPPYPRVIRLQDCLRLYTAPEPVHGVICTPCSIIEKIGSVKESIQAYEMMLKDALENGNVDGSETEIEMTLLDYKDILDSLEKMLETCHVDDDVEIEIPAIQTVCNKSMMISCSPDVFCFHLNRKVYNPDSGRMKKLVTHVDFPIELNMSEFCAIENAANASNTSGKQLFHEGFLHSTTTKKHLIYELTAVILHQGNENGGHFTSFRRVSSENGNNFARGPYNSQWFHISDDRVRPVSLQDVLSSCAYMLFYERKTRRRQANLSGQFHMSNFTSMNEKKTL